MASYPTTPLKFLWFYVRQKKIEVGGLFLLMGISTICARFTIQYFSRIIDILGQVDKATFWPMLWPAVAMMIGLDVAAIFTRRLGLLYDLRVTPWIVKQVSHDVSGYLMGHSARFLADQSSGKLASRAGQLSGDLCHMMGILEFDFFFPLISALITFFMLFSVNWSCGVLFVVWIVILAFMFRKYAGKIRFVSEKEAEKGATVVGRIVDIVSNALTVKCFSNWGYEKKLLTPLLDAHKKEMEKLFAMQNNIQTVQSLVVSLFRLTMIGLCLFLWTQNKVTTGNIVLTLLLCNTMVESVRYMMFAYNSWSRVVGSMRNALSSIFSPYEIQESPHAQSLKVTQGQIDFQNVDFGYRSKSGVFKHFNLSIRPGERVGLVGISGSGKSSLIHLLQRFYDVNGGQILIDGQDIRSVTQESLHRAISFVPQDTSLFHRSLYENIAYGHPGANKNQIMRASRLAYAHDFISKTDKGYQTFVGDRGVKLSGGQRQRIAIARAILKRAPILILDEATSALDSESEINIQKSLKNLMKGKTVIAIAHRLSTLREMDRIVVMHRGKVIEQGKPAELLKKKGKYAHLWELQTQGFLNSD